MFTQQPAKSSINQGIPFTIQLLNSKGKPVSAKGLPQYALDITITDFNNPASGYSAYRTPPLTGGKYVNIDPPTDLAPIAIPTAATYIISVSANDPVTDELVTPVIACKPFQVTGLHLAFIHQPPTTAINTLIPFQVELLYSKNSPALPPGADDNSVLTLEIIPVSGTGSLDTITGSFPYGFYDDRSSSEIIPVEIPTPGTYKIVAEGVEDDGIPVANIQPATSKVFTIKG